MNSSGPRWSTTTAPLVDGPRIVTITSVIEGVTRLVPVFLGGYITASPTSTINATGTEASLSASSLNVQIVGLYLTTDQSMYSNTRASAAQRSRQSSSRHKFTSSRCRYPGQSRCWPSCGGFAMQWQETAPQLDTKSPESSKPLSPIPATQFWASVLDPEVDRLRATQNTSPLVSRPR